MAKTIEPTKPWSPYQTDNYQKCPLLWDLGKRWQRREEHPMVNMLVGTAVALGLERHYKGFTDGLEKADELVQVQYKEGSKTSLKGTRNLVQQGIELGMATNLGVSQILAVEEFYGNIKPDLVAKQGQDLVVIDHKVKMKLDDQYLEKELQGYDVSNQLWHYGWAVGMEHGEPVQAAIIHMIILAPFPRTLLHPVKLTPEGIKHWLHGVTRDWKGMTAIAKGLEEPGARFSSCVGKYGMCDFGVLCHTLHGDESMAPTFYDKVEKRF